MNKPPCHDTKCPSRVDCARYAGPKYDRKGLPDPGPYNRAHHADRCAFKKDKRSTHAG